MSVTLFYKVDSLWQWALFTCLSLSPSLSLSLWMFPPSGSFILVVCRWAGHVRFPQSCIRKEHTEPATIGNVYTSPYTLLYEMPGVRWPLWTHRVTCAPNCPPCWRPYSPLSSQDLSSQSHLSTPPQPALHSLPLDSEHSELFSLLFFSSRMLFPERALPETRESFSFSNFISPPPFFSDEFFSSLPAFPL